MVPMIPLPGLSVQRKAAALWVAGIVDFIQMPGFAIFGEGFLSIFQDVLDFLTAMLLVAICGFRWQFALAFAVELVPGLSLFPTWTMVVLMLPTRLEEQWSEAGAGGAGAQRVVVNRVDVAEDSEPHEHEVDNDAVHEVDVDGVVLPPVQAPRIRSTR